MARSTPSDTGGLSDDEPVPTIAEGCGKRGNNEFYRYLQIASGSASELDYHFLLARDLHFLGDPDYSKMANSLSQLRRMLTSLLQKIDTDRSEAER